MWGQVTSIFGRFGRTAPATQPCVSTDFSTGVCTQPAATSPDRLLWRFRCRRTPYRRAYTLFRRLDRIYVSRNMTLKDNPTITNIRHVIPTDGDLLALKRIGSTSKWSDHSSVEIRVRYTDTLKQKRPWTFPKHTLTNDLEEVKRIRESANTLLASIDNNTDPRKALSTWMAELKVHTENRSKEERKIHIQKKHTIIGQLKKIYKKVGDGMGKEGSMNPPTNVEQKEAREAMEIKRDEYEERIGEYTRKEQQIWLDDRGYEEYTSGERCSRRFFYTG